MASYSKLLLVVEVAVAAEGSSSTVESVKAFLAAPLAFQAVGKPRRFLDVLNAKALQRKQLLHQLQ